MKTRKLATKVNTAHATVAQWLADAYVRNLKADTRNALPTLETIVQAYRYEIAQAVSVRLFELGAHGTNVRHDLLRNLAEGAVRERICADETLWQKLVSIRAAQQASDCGAPCTQADVFRAFPVASWS